MITTLIFDFGDVFINLDKQGALDNALELFELQQFDDAMIQTNITYEVGEISTSEFIQFYRTNFSQLDNNQIITAWNYILKDFPKYRYDWLKKIALSNRFDLILLSNTNALHIDFIERNVPFYEDFKASFDAFYLSHEINLRKPNASIFEFVLNEHHLLAKNCLFIDDTKENIDTANTLGFKTWYIDETSEDVVTLFETKKHLF